MIAPSKPAPEDVGHFLRIRIDCHLAQDVDELVEIERHLALLDRVGLRARRVRFRDDPLLERGRLLLRRVIPATAASGGDECQSCEEWYREPHGRLDPQMSGSSTTRPRQPCSQRQPLHFVRRGGGTGETPALKAGVPLRDVWVRLPPPASAQDGSLARISIGAKRRRRPLSRPQRLAYF